ncbi:hypothetical protein V496_01553 [Pseudogymnoascus sp. VKM F-4515 (FW-2607)]|nr:hypothetical protein V496_01553 [Pseudogymnoascus sp. VKM F-4515 (FW-2607)]
MTASNTASAQAASSTSRVISVVTDQHDQGQGVMQLPAYLAVDTAVAHSRAQETAKPRASAAHQSDSIP